MWWLQVERTERVKNCQDPEFSSKLHIDYHFEKVQKLKFGVYDIDNKSVDLNDDDYLGGFECTLGQVCIVRIVIQWNAVAAEQLVTIYLIKNITYA